MKFETYLPNKFLRSFIKAYHIVESDKEVVNRILPDTSLTMVIRFKGLVSQQTGNIKMSLPPLIVSGLRKTGRLINYAGGSGNIIIRFKEAAASVFIKEPLHQFYESSVALSSLGGYQDISALEDDLHDTNTNEQRISLVENFLQSKLRLQTPDALILSAIDKINNSKGELNMRSLAHAHNLSQDAFEKRFRQTAGTSPKKFAYLVRMTSVIKNGTNGKPLVETAVNAGFFDQSHFNKDFKLFTGMPPSEFFRSKAHW